MFISISNKFCLLDNDLAGNYYFEFLSCFSFKLLIIEYFIDLYNYLNYVDRFAFLMLNKSIQFVSHLDLLV